MTCNEAMELAPLHLSCELEGAVRAAMQQHLRSCRICASELEQMAESDARLREAIAAEPMDTTAIDAKIRESIGGHRRAWVRPAIGIAAALVLAVLGWRGLRQPAPDMVCTTAATDHHREVIEGRQHNWLTDPAAIEALAAREGLDASTLTRLVPADVKLSRGKRCRILGTPYVHLVYAQGSNEFSVFLRAEAGDANGVYTGTAGPDRVAWFHSARVRGVVVETGDGASAARIARSAAAVL